MKVLVAAGASGGHVYPALATAVVLRERNHEVVFAGGDRLEARVVPEAGFAFHALPVRRPPSVRAELATPRGVAAMSSIAFATLRARGLVRRIGPDVVLGMGGFASVPIALAAGWGRPRLVLHEQNAHLSLAQKISLRWCDVLAMGLPIEEGVQHARAELVGNPVRSAIASLATLDAASRTAARADAVARLDLDPSRRTILVLGGSLGSGPLNTVVPALALPADVQVLHVAGPTHEEATRKSWAGSGVTVRVFGFLDAIEDAYLVADLAIARSGASTVAELALAAVPAVFVPLPTLARGDQAANARVPERAGAAVVVPQSDPGFADSLGRQVVRLLADEVARAAMRTAAASIAVPDAAERLADVVGSAASAPDPS